MVKVRGGTAKDLEHRDLAIGWNEIVALLKPPANAITKVNDIRPGNGWGQLAVVSILTARSDSSIRQTRFKVPDTNRQSSQPVL